MKKFITKLIYFLIPIIIAGATLEYFIRSIPNDYKLKKTYLDSNSKNIEYLFLGSSHSLYGVNPEFFSKHSFNASYVSQSLDYDFEILKMYENDWKSLKVIFVPISYFSLYSTIGSKSAVRIRNYNIYYGMNKTLNISNYFEIFNQKLKVNVKRVVDYFHYGISSISVSPLGWGVSFSSKIKNDLKVFGEDAARRHTFEYNEYVEKNIKSLNDIKQFGKQKKIQIIFYTPPAYYTYYNHLDPKQLNETVSIMKNLVKTCSHCTYLNLLKDVTFEKNDFYDGDHLNEIGAKKLTLLLKSYLK